MLLLLPRIIGAPHYHQVVVAGVILGAVAGPIRRYLRERKDTIRCIVTMLTDDGAEDVGALFAELGNMETVGEVGGFKASRAYSFLLCC